jgi:1-aminocyclopropane-1-carboxylate deaminase
MKCGGTPRHKRVRAPGSSKTTELEEVPTRSSGFGCALLHNSWAPGAGEFYRSVGNILLSHLLGAQLYHDETARHIDDQGQRTMLAERLRECGRRSYLIPGCGSDHRLAAAISAAHTR